MKIISFCLGIIFAYFIIKIFKTKLHGYNSTQIKNLEFKKDNDKFRYIPITYTCIYNIKHK